MTGRNKRGIRRAACECALAVASSGTRGRRRGGGGGGSKLPIATAEAAQNGLGFTMHTGRTMGYTDAVSSAMNGWAKSPSNSLMTLSHMQPMTNTMTMAWHTHTIALQRGTVVAESIRQEGTRRPVQQRRDRDCGTWNNGNTKAVNVGNSSTGMSAMTGGTMSMPSRWGRHLNTTAKAAVKGDLVFVFGEKVKGKLIHPAGAVRGAVEGRPSGEPSATPTAPMTTTPTARHRRRHRRRPPPRRPSPPRRSHRRTSELGRTSERGTRPPARVAAAIARNTNQVPVGGPPCRPRALARPAPDPQSGGRPRAASRQDQRVDRDEADELA